MNRSRSLICLLVILLAGCAGTNPRSYLERKQDEAAEAATKSPEDAQADIERELSLYSD